MHSVHPLNTRFHERRQKSIHMTQKEVSESIRMAIIAELDLINMYEQLADAMKEEQTKRVFNDLAKEELEHVGRLLALLVRLEPGTARLLREGIEKTEKRLGIRVEL